MAKFDVFRSPDRGYWLDCQSDLLSYLNSRFVAPLELASEVTQIGHRLNPSFDIEGQTMVLMTHLASAVAAKELKEFVLSLADHDMAITAAFDTLILGY